MKYARTEDGHILEVGKTTDYGFVVMPKCEYATHFLEDDETESVPIIALSDNLKELCDYFVALDCNGKIVAFDRDADKVMISGIYCAAIIGSILTKKGIIFVTELTGEGWVLL